MEFLRSLITERYNGDVAAFGRAMKYSSERFADRYLNPDRQDARNIGDKAARAIEKVHHLPRGAMDLQAIDPLEAQLVTIYRTLSDAGRDALLGAAQRILVRERPESSIANPFPEKPMPTEPALPRRGKR